MPSGAPCNCCDYYFEMLDFGPGISDPSFRTHAWYSSFDTGSRIITKDMGGTGLAITAIDDLVAATAGTSCNIYRMNGDFLRTISSLNGSESIRPSSNGYLYAAGIGISKIDPVAGTEVASIVGANVSPGDQYWSGPVEVTDGWVVANRWVDRGSNPDSSMPLARSLSALGGVSTLFSTPTTANNCRCRYFAISPDRSKAAVIWDTGLTGPTQDYISGYTWSDTSPTATNVFHTTLANPPRAGVVAIDNDGNCYVGRASTVFEVYDFTGAMTDSAVTTASQQSRMDWFNGNLYVSASRLSEQIQVYDTSGTLLESSEWQTTGGPTDRVNDVYRVGSLYLAAGTREAL